MEVLSLFSMSMRSLRMRDLYLASILALVMSLVACKRNPAVAGSGASTTDVKESMPANPKSPGNKQPQEAYNPADFTKGPAILPKKKLLAFFESQSKGQVYKIPVVIIYDDSGLRGKEAFIGVEVNTPDQDKLQLDLDDSGLGIGLDDRMLSAFGDQKVCHVWIIGKWGAIMDLPALESEGHGFTVRDMQRREDGPKRNANAYVWLK